MIKTSHIITDGLNTDNAPRYIKRTEAVNIVACDTLLGDDGSDGAITNMRANKLVDHPDVIEGYGYRVIGGCEDIVNNRYFYFIASEKKDLIMCYRKDQDDILKVMDSNDVNEGFRFNYARYIDSIIIGKQLIFVDGVNSQKKINVEKALLANNASYVPPDGIDETPYVFPLEQVDITLLRPGPFYPPSISKNNDPSYNGNFINEEAFFFAYAFEYYDGEISVVSPYSRLASYNNPDDPYDYNSIVVSIPHNQEIRDTVRKVFFMAKHPYHNEFYIVATIDREENSQPFIDHNGNGDSMSIKFYNDSIGVPIDEGRSVIQYDAVPITSACLEIIRNRVFLANNVEGYDRVFIDGASASVVSQDNGTSLIGEYVFVQTSCDDDPDNPSNPPEVLNTLLVRISGSGDPNIDGWYEYSNDYSYQDFLSGSLPQVIELSAGQRKGSLSDFPNAQSLILFFYEGNCPPDPIYVTGSVDYNYNGTQPTIIGLTGQISGFDGMSVFKENSSYQLGIVFYDFLYRHNGVATSSDLQVYTLKRTYNTNNFNTGIKWTLPQGYVSWIPDWARYYQIVRTKNLNYDFFVQGLCEKVQYASKDDSGAYQYGDTYTEGSTLGIAFDLTRLIDVGLGYIYQEGDLVRVLPNDDSDEVVLKVVDVQGKYVITEAKDIGSLGSSNIYEPCIIEIFTPHKRYEDELFYEVGVVHKILSPGGFQRSFEVHQGVLPGDSYIKERFLGSASLFFEAMSPDDKLYKNWFTDAGRPMSQNRIGQKKLETSIRWSSTSINETSVNGTSEFAPTDQYVLERNIGELSRIIRTSKTQQEGNILLAIGKNGSASLYIGESQIIDNSSQVLTASSGQVIGTVNALRGSYGTVHPESVKRYKGSVFFFDLLSGNVVQYSSNGLMPISHYKMRKYFKQISEKIIISGEDHYIPGGVNNRSGQYWINMPGLYTGEEQYYNDYSERVGAGSFNANNPVSYDIDIYPNVDYTIDITFLSSGHHDIEIFVSGVSVISDSTNDNNASYQFVYNGEDPGQLSIHSNFDGFFILSTGMLAQHNIYDKKDKVIVFFHESNKAWSNTIPIKADYFGEVGDLLLSFKNGKCYPFNSNKYNVFFETEIESKFSIVLNDGGSAVKMPMTIEVYSDERPYRLWARSYDPEQGTDLVAEDFVYREGSWQASFLFDRLNPNGSSDFDENLYRGTRVRSDIVYITIEFRNFESKFRVDDVVIGWIPSSGH